jgi:microcompartment protein PduB
MTEFVGTAMGDTIGLVIANVDPALHEMMKIDKKYRSIGIVGGRTGAGPQLMAADEAVKATNTEIVAIELPRDCKGGAGHGNLIIFGAEDVSDARRAVEVTLDTLPTTFGAVYANDAGHIELQYTARASYVCNKPSTLLWERLSDSWWSPRGYRRHHGRYGGKAANVDVIGYASPAGGTSLTNEVILSSAEIPAQSDSP